MTRRMRRVWLAIATSFVVVTGLVAVFIGPDLFSARDVFDSSKPTEGLTDVLRRSVPADAPRIEFTDVAEEAGLRFVHSPGPRHALITEDMGPGVALADYDGDGDLDVYVTNQPSSFLDPDPNQGENRLFRNRGDGTFEDVTEHAGVGDRGFGMGACFGDIDGDGDLDLYVTNVGANVMFENRGDGTFVDITEKSNTGCRRFGAGAIFADFDRDGDLDLYVTNYLEFDASRRGPPSQQYGTGVPYTLNPSSYPPQANRLYRNDGSGRFTDVAPELGVDDGMDRSLGATICDFDGDARPEIYVANDITTNRMYTQPSGGATEPWRDVSAESLTADYKGAMGLAVGDYDLDADQDIFITHWVAQENTLYRNASAQLRAEGNSDANFFEDVSDAVGLGAPALMDVGWGTHFIDVDDDGYLDVFVVNGHTLHDDSLKLIAQPNRLFWNAGERGFFEITPVCGSDLGRPNVARGSAVGDLDGDGDVDIVVARNRGPLAFFRNESRHRNAWIAVRLIGPRGNPRGIGARIAIEYGDRRTAAVVGASPSYLSQNSSDVHFGLGNAARVEAITITWPDGRTQRVTQTPTRGLLTIRHGHEGYEVTR